MLSAIHHVLLHATTEAELFRQLCKLIVDIGGYRMTWVGFKERDPEKTVRPACHAGDEAGYFAQVPLSWGGAAEEHDPSCTAIHTGQPVSYHDIALVSDTSTWRDEALARGFRSVIALPLIVEQHVIGAFTIYGETPGTFPATDQQLMIELADDIAFGIVALRVRSQRQHLAEKLHESENKFRDLVENISDWVWEVDEQARYTYASPRARQLIGYEPAEIVGKLPFDFMSPDEAKRVAELLNPIVARQEPFSLLEHTMVRKDGQLVYVETSGIPLFDAQGTFTGYRGIDRNFTERKQMEEALKASEEKYRTLFAIEPDALFLIDFVSLRVLDANDAALRLYGYSHREISELTVRDLTLAPAEASEQIRTIRRGEVMRVPSRHHVRKDGSVFTVELAASLYDLHGRRVIVAAIRDTTERLKIEEALQASEEKYRTLFSVEPDAIFLADLETMRMLDANGAALRLFGYSRKEFLSLTIMEITAEPGATRASIQSLKGTTIIRVPLRYYVRKDGTPFPVEISASLYDLHGRKVIVAAIRDITERKQIEEALQASEEKYRTLFSVEPDALFFFDAQTFQVLDADEAALRAYGYTREEFLSLTALDITSEPETARFQIESLAEGDLLKVPLRYHVRKGGTLFPVEIYARIAYLQGRKVMVAAIRDITERLHAEEALKDSEELYRTLFEVEPDALLLLDLDTLQHIDANEAALQMYGYTRDEFLSLNVLAFLTDPEPAKKMFLSIKVGETRMVPRIYHIRKDGSVFPVEVHTRVFLFHGRKTMCAAVRDITDRVLAEETIKHDRAFLLTAIEALPVALLFLSADRQLVLANVACYRFFRDHDWRHWADVQWLTPNHIPIPQEQWPIARALSQGETLSNIEGIVRFPNGDEVPVLHQVAPVIVDGKLVAAVAVFQDITALKEADEAKNQFLMLLSHEVKTPLTSIIGWAQMAQSDPTEANEALQVILRNALEQKNILERMLTLSRILTGKLIFILEPIDLRRLTEELVVTLQQETTQRAIRITCKMPAEKLLINADRKLMRLALNEILDNAVKFTEAGGQITVSGERSGDRILLSVQDTGRGIAPEQLPNLLKPFKQIQREELFGGLGVGLALVRGIVEAHGGQVHIASPGIGQGTTVTLDLPAATDR